MRLQAAAIYTASVPELGMDPPTNTHIVPEGELVGASSEFNYLSMFFYMCTGLAIRGENKNYFGFFHVYDRAYIPKEAARYLALLAGGTFVAIERLEDRVSKKSVYHQLAATYGITQVDTIDVHTCADDGNRYAFHTIFRPKRNEIVVARISHADVKTFEAFRN